MSQNEEILAASLGIPTKAMALAKVTALGHTRALPGRPCVHESGTPFRVVFCQTPRGSSYALLVHAKGAPIKMDMDEVQVQCRPLSEVVKKNSARSALGNGKTPKPFDPREWHAHACANRMYETSMVNEVGDTVGWRQFRKPNDQRQTRLDAVVYSRVGQPLLDLAKNARSYAIATGKKRYYTPASAPQGHGPTPEATATSFNRYAGTHVGSDGKVRDHTDLMNSRQSYEEMLAMGRGEGFYRITVEPTTGGDKYFIWPLPPGQRLPFPALPTSDSKSLGIVQSMADQIEREQNPFATGRWHVPECNYTQSELSHWLPPLEVFAGAGVAPVRPTADAARVVRERMVQQTSAPAPRSAPAPAPRTGDGIPARLRSAYSGVLKHEVPGIYLVSDHKGEWFCVSEAGEVLHGPETYMFKAKRWRPG